MCLHINFHQDYQHTACSIFLLKKVIIMDKSIHTSPAMIQLANFFSEVAASERSASETSASRERCRQKFCLWKCCHLKHSTWKRCSWKFCCSKRWSPSGCPTWWLVSRSSPACLMHVWGQVRTVLARARGWWSLTGIVVVCYPTCTRQ
jgi:hypothetical protein